MITPCGAGISVKRKTSINEGVKESFSHMIRVGETSSQVRSWLADRDSLITNSITTLKARKSSLSLGKDIFCLSISKSYCRASVCRVRHAPGI